MPPATQIYLSVDPARPRIDAAELADTCHAGQVAAVLFREGAAGPGEAARIAELASAAASTGAMPILDWAGGPEPAILGPGLHVPSADLLARARKLVAAGAPLGVSCGLSRHEAMTAAEAGADYVAFGPGALDASAPTSPSWAAMLDLLGWWQDMMELPCVAEGAETFLRARELALAGADFVLVDRLVWDDPRGPQPAIADLIGQLSR